jgi:2-keto-3-deoxy-L-rhamnonate aldolase RhmA
MLPDPDRAPRLPSAAVTEDLIAARWLAGEPAFAAWLLLESPSAAEVLGGAGFDAVVIDLQHGAATLDGLAHLVARSTRRRRSRSSEPRPTIPPT